MIIKNLVTVCLQQVGNTGNGTVQQELNGVTASASGMFKYFDFQENHFKSERKKTGHIQKFTIYKNPHFLSNLHETW